MLGRFQAPGKAEGPEALERAFRWHYAGPMDAMLIFLVAVFLALHAADLALTLRGLALGKRERNPLARFLMRRMGRVPGLVFLKLATIACVALLAVQLPPLWQAISIAALSLVGLLVVMKNVKVVRRA